MSASEPSRSWPFCRYCYSGLRDMGHGRLYAIWAALHGWRDFGRVEREYRRRAR